MNIESLLDLYCADEKTKRISERLIENPPSHLHLMGIVSSQDAFVASAVNKISPQANLFIFNDKEEAAFFFNDFQNLGSKNIFFFSDSFKHTGQFDEINSNNVLLRTEALNFFNSPRENSVIITYPEALFEKVISPQTLNKNTFLVRVGEKLDIDFTIEFLVAHNFERTDFVYEPGEFAIRGGIIDIFSFGNEMPYRIELSGDAVESIRIFDPETQLSDRKITKLTIVPNLQNSSLADFSDDADKEKENQRTSAEDQKISLLNFLPTNTVVWMKDVQLIADKLEENFEKIKNIQASLTDSSLRGTTRPDSSVGKQSPPEQIASLSLAMTENFLAKENFLNDLKNRSTIEFGKRFYFPPTAIFQYNSSPQPSFNRNFNLLTKDLLENQENNFLNFIFTDNTKQIERFYQIFEDINSSVIASEAKQSPNKVQIASSPMGTRNDESVKWFPIPHAISKGFIDKDLKVACYTDHQIFDRYHKYHLREGYSKSRALLLKQLRELKSGDYVTHIDHGIGVYSGLEKIEVGGHIQEAVRIVYANNDLLYVGINSLHKISKFTGKEGTVPKINKLGSDAWENLKRKTKKKVKDIAKDLIALYSKRKAQKGFAFSPDSYLQTELEASFIYEDTPDQVKATADVKRDMEQESPMDRLVCGDVGFGKTEIAVRAAFKAVADSKQVAILVPTTILALQHFKTFSERLKDFPCAIDYVNRFRSAKEQKDIFKKLEEGKIDIVIGTHGLLSGKIKFKDLGLLVIDEEQKFGVASKEKIRAMKSNVDTLTLTATPIPRTLHFSLMGARDLSIINTPPPNRQPIQTEVHIFNEELIRDAIYFETFRGGQIFFVHNKVKDIMEIVGMLQRICPDVKFGVAHGQMEGHHLEEAMMKFSEREYDVLVSTNIVESGLDMPNVNTIIINHAHQFGLSDLHQLRGRVGRSNKKAFCYLLAPPMSTLTTDARKRLQTIEEFADLGSGFNISLRDLDIRGAGNLLGAEQSGFIAEIGFEMYHKILDEAMQELKETDFKELFKDELQRENKFVRDCQIETDAEAWIPDGYVKNINERLALYTRLDNIEPSAPHPKSLSEGEGLLEDSLEKFGQELVDRFGPLPEPVTELFNAIRLRWLAKELGFEKIFLKNGEMKCFFVENKESAFYQSKTFSEILSYIQKNPKRCRLKETEKFLILNFYAVMNLGEGEEELERMVSERN